MATEAAAHNDTEIAPGLIPAVEALLRVTGTGMSGESDAQAYVGALETVLQAARAANRRVLFDATLHIAHNLAVLRDRPEALAQALLPLLDFPIAIHDCLWHAHNNGSADVLLACLADPQWPEPLRAEGEQRLRALFAVGDSATDGPPVVPDRGVAHDSERLWRLRAGPILELGANPPAPLVESAPAKPDLLKTSGDSSDRQRAQAKRRELEGQLRHAQKMEAIAALAGGIANDFNNVLSAILGNLALACDELGHQPAALRSLDQIDRAARRGTKLVQEILSFSRLEPHELVNRPLQPLLRESLDSLRATLPAGVKLEAALEQAPLHVLADATKMRQVLAHLWTNAVQALQGGPGRIGVVLEAIEFVADSPRRPAALGAGEYAHLSVSDSGRGMDLATRDRIFEPYFTTQAAGAGAGMGLSVVHGIVATHQGAIGVDSAPGQGSTFHLYFPLARAEDAARVSGQRVSGQSQALPAPSVAKARGQHVLYLDDDDMMLMLGESLLRRRGYRVTCFQEPRIALATVRAHPKAFDLVLTDLNMSDLSGFEVARELARIRPDLPVAVSSGDLGEQRRAELKRCGVRGLIHKGSMFTELGPLVDRLLAEAASAPAA